MDLYSVRIFILQQKKKKHKKGKETPNTQNFTTKLESINSVLLAQQHPKLWDSPKSGTHREQTGGDPQGDKEQNFHLSLLGALH